MKQVAIFSPVTTAVQFLLLTGKPLAEDSRLSIVLGTLNEQIKNTTSYIYGRSVSHCIKQPVNN